MFGSVSTLAKPVVSSVNPLLLSAIVYMTAAAVLAPVAYRRKNQRATTTVGEKKKQGRRLDYLLVIAIAFAGSVIAPSLYFAGLQQTSASDATLLANGEIIFTIAIAMAFFKERLRPLGYLAVLFVLVGVIIVTTNLHFAGSSVLFSKETYYGNLLILGSTLFWAIDNNVSKLVAKRIDNVAKIAYLKGAIGGGILLVVALFLGVSIGGEVRQNQIVPILLLGSVGFGGSLYFFLEGLKRIGAVRAILLLSLSSIFGLVFAAIFMGEQVSIYQGIAAAVMLCGIYLVNRKQSSLVPA